MSNDIRMSEEEVLKVDNFICNTSIPPVTGSYFPVTNPATCEIIGQVAISGVKDVETIVTGAECAFPGWSNRTMGSRVALMQTFHSLVDKYALDIAKLIVLENGKNITEALAEVAKGNETVWYACSLPSIMEGKILQVSTDIMCCDRHDPLGVVSCVVPFNFPFMVPMWTIPIAMITGNCVIVKPSEKVPLTLNFVSKLFLESGFPPGVFQLLNGDANTVKALIAHPQIRAMTFVGSSPVAKSIHEQCSSLQKRVLALGGAKNHLVALKDANIASAASDIVTSFAGCAGQRCMAASVLLLVEDNPALLNAVIEKASQIQPGQQERQMGPVIDLQSFHKIQKYITKSVQQNGAKIMLDGRSWSTCKDRKGYWIGPTVLLHKQSDAPAMVEEIFGPVLNVYICNSWAEAIDIEKANPYGNAASIYTSIGHHADYFIQRFKSAMLGVNVGIPVPREPFSFGGLYGTLSKYGDFDITGDGAAHFFTNRVKVTSRWPKPSLNLKTNIGDTSYTKSDKANFAGQM